MRKGSTQTRPARSLAALFLLALALALPAPGQAAEAGSISGTVTAKRDGEWLGNIEVCAGNSGVSGGEGDECASTNENGEYEITGLPAGEYKVEFNGDLRRYVNQYYKEQLEWEKATSVIVVAGVPTVIDAQLEKAGLISGFVQEAGTERAVEGVEVCAREDSGKAPACAVSNWVGGYTIQGLPAGTYEVGFFVDETQLNLLSQPYGGGVRLLEGWEVDGFDVSLEAAGQISGTVRAAATGAPLEDVEVCLTEASETWPLACLVTTRSGAYRFFGVWAGSFKVVFSPEASELEEGEYWEIEPDAFPAQWWNGEPSFETATPIDVNARANVDGIDGSLGPGPTVIVPPEASATNASQPSPLADAKATTARPKPKLRCRRGFAEKKVKGKARCVARHNAKRHHAKRRP